tara:strand:- start:154 stop:546 length:393 start_codon:yes stop_codon:yes gene_type:complete
MQNTSSLPLKCRYNNITYSILPTQSLDAFILIKSIAKSILYKIFFDTFQMVRMDLPPNWADNQRAQLRTLVQLAYNTHYKFRDLHLLIKNSLSLVAVAVGEHCQQKKQTTWISRTLRSPSGQVETGQKNR